VGFDWPDPAAVLDKVREETDELRVEVARGDRARAHEELGDLLFALTQVARHLEIDPEESLRAANAKFERRFRHVESQLASQGRTPRDAGMAELEALWIRAKREPG
jgi:ATP diphosphatase